MDADNVIVVLAILIGLFIIFIPVILGVFVAIHIWNFIGPVTPLEKAAALITVFIYSGGVSVVAAKLINKIFSSPEK